jgi:glycosyltransferase involved in cell wall biosynthesis
LLVESRSLDQITRAIKDLVQNPEQRELLIEKGRKQSSNYSWRKTAEKTAIYLSEAVSRKQQGHNTSLTKKTQEKVSVN